IDILNVRYVLSVRPRAASRHLVAAQSPSETTAASSTPATQILGETKFAESDLGLPSLGAGKRLEFSLPPATVDRVALLTNMSWSETVPDGTVVGHVRLSASDGRNFDLPLQAGRDTSEWAYDRPDIRRRIRHSRAKVGTSYSVDGAQGKYEAHTYLAMLSLPEKSTITSGQIEVEPSPLWPDLLLSVFRVSLSDSSDGKAFPLQREWIAEGPASDAKSATAQPTDSRWRLVTRTSQVDIYENGRALPRAWLVTSAMALPEQAILDVIRTGKLPDGRHWDPQRMGLIETEVGLNSSEGSSSPAANITKHEPNRIEVKTASMSPVILVVSENHYPGWRSYVDGQPVETLRINYNQRGVLVPAGEHTIEMVYRPKSLLLGLVVSLLTAALLGFWWAGLVGMKSSKTR
ncbi:MAG TPA: YfhO family protein, partial [Pyrinomonadaceae bacterium]|nr:YfhO family protein [Pyrinomonadaceae bacterium]